MLIELLVMIALEVRLSVEDSWVNADGEYT